jgi:hypothetical protein
MVNQSRRRQSTNQSSEATMKNDDIEKNSLLPLDPTPSHLTDISGFVEGFSVDGFMRFHYAGQIDQLG